MKTCTFQQKTNQYVDLAAAKLADAREMAAVGYGIAQTHIAAMLSHFVLSEIFVLKFMLISLGVLIGTMFSDFFKKHRNVVIIAFFVSVGLFVYKTFQLIGELGEASDDF